MALNMLGEEIPRYKLITPRVAAYNSVTFTVSTSPGYEMVTLAAHGLSDGESIPIEIQVGDSWVAASTVHPDTGLDTPIALSYGANVVSIVGLGNYRAAKPVTTLAASVTLYR